MCEEAEEIQELMLYILTSTHLKGNIFICTDKESANYFWRMETFQDVGDEVGSSVHMSTKNIWLPTQEQLQDMTEGRFHIWGNLNSLSMTASTADRDTHQICKNIDSMNELWLMYVMKEKWNKKWTGKDWVKEVNNGISTN